MTGKAKGEQMSDQHVTPEITDEPSVSTDSLHSTRRTVLRGAGVATAAAAGAGLLAACGGDTPAANQPAAQNTPVGAGTATSSTTSAAPGTSAPAAAAGDLAVADVPVGGGVIVKDKKAVVTQPAAGEFKAFDFTCTHEGCAVTSVADGAIICPCHNSHFDITTGDPTAGPAAKPLAAKTVTVNGDQLSIT